MAQKRDYYEVLGVAKDADENQIKKAYWKLAKQYHPDVNPGDKEAEAKFKEANEAYEVLSNAEKRQRYDQFGHAGVDPNGFGAGAGGFGGGFAGFDLQDLFNSIFGMGFGAAAGAQRRRGPTPGENLLYRMPLDFMEAAFGCEKEISIRKEDICQSCHGHGTKDGKEPPVCSVCHGSGQVTAVQKTILGDMMSTKTCQACRGTGKEIKDPCPTCHGSGRVLKTKKLSVRIPAGINENERLTVRGEGEPGENGGPYGDLYIAIQIRPHPVFDRHGNTTFCEVPITYAQAALGQEIEVPTIDGPEKFKLKEGTQAGDEFTIRGKGIPYIHRNNVRGDHVFRVSIEVPNNLSNAQKELLQRFDETCNESHYKKRTGFFDKLKNIFNKG